MPEVCVDACVAIKWYVMHEPYRSKAIRLRDASLKVGRTIIAPPLLEMEIDSIVQGRVADGLITPAVGDRILKLIDAAPIVTVAEPGVRLRARAIARQFNQRKVYDATYAALAEIRGCDLWTADQNFYSQVRTTLPFVKYLPNYP